MNNGEAHDAFTVLEYFLKLPRSGGPVPIEKAKESAVRLADRAYKQLAAGTRGEVIAERFDELAEVVAMADELLGRAIEQQAADGNEVAALLLAEVIAQTGEQPEVNGQ